MPAGSVISPCVVPIVAPTTAVAVIPAFMAAAVSLRPNVWTCAVRVYSVNIGKVKTSHFVNFSQLYRYLVPFFDYVRNLCNPLA
jgi:hypothetical protein